ncbi:phosphate acetyltransferase [Ornithinimicrobium sp. Arc0846-15]|nr:phosphate acetyltransferase [Ornithinimicrobium laminariae]
MTNALYLASAESASGKSALAVGLITELSRTAGRVGVFRPIVMDPDSDPILDLLLPMCTSSANPNAAYGVTHDSLHSDEKRAVAEIVDRFHAYANEHDMVLVVGSDFSGIASPNEFSLNAAVAANIGAPLLLVVPGVDRSPEQIVTTADIVMSEAAARHAHVVGVIANRVASEHVEATREALAKQHPEVFVQALESDELLQAPTVRNISDAIDGQLIAGDDELMDRETPNIVVAGMTLPNVLDRLTEGCVVICPGDREEITLAAVLAHQSSTSPTLAGLILNGGFRPSRQVQKLMDGLEVKVPIVLSPGGTMATASAASRALGRITPTSHSKIERARAIVAEQLDLAAILPEGASQTPSAMTPLMFEHQLTARARATGATVVLPEGSEDRILRAADIVLRRGIAKIILLGDEDSIRARAATLGLDLSEAKVIDPTTDERLPGFAKKYAELRAHKGVTVEQAQDTVTDSAYFGTLMVLTGEADGMVSGSITTTAATIRPALEIIRTKPGVSVVSSVFFMCLADKVLVYGDCAINPDPNAEQLADIAVTSAATASQFGVDPLVAMLSYSTGGSGSGADVEKVREATTLVKERASDLAVEGPIQYDAAVDPSVAATKLKESAVAGKASVLIFPDLNTGNNTYKAVQRSASAVAIGPVLQGLNMPVNDLSRGSTVQDIVNTISITAIQAKG